MRGVRSHRLRALAVVLAVLAGCGRAGGRQASVLPIGGASRAAPNAVVTRVVDGDTIRARISGRQERVRFIGIDTPESVKPNTPVQCFALAASARTKALLPPGTAIRLVRDAEARDRYHRLLAYVYRSRDGLFVNLALVREGFARPYTFPPNVAHEAEFVAAAAQARAQGKGLWSRC